MIDLDPQPTPLRHPFVDEYGDGWIAFFTDRELVHASVARIGLLVDANRAGVVPVIVTQAYARLTWPMLQYVGEFGAVWLVRGLDGGFVNGLTGVETSTIHDAVSQRTAPILGPTGALAANRDSGHSTAAKLVQLTLIVHHRARFETILGGALETLALPMTGSPLSSWGQFEPLPHEWDAQKLTESVRTQMPETVRYVAACGNAVGRLSATARVSRTEHGVSENLRVLVSVPTTIPVVPTIHTLFESLATEHQIVFGSAFSVHGRQDLSFGLASTGAPVPIAVLIGARAIRDTAINVANLAEELNAVSLGRPRTPSALLTFDQEPATAWEQLNAAASHFDPTLVARAMGFGATNAA